MHQIFVALGANLAQPLAQLHSAVDALRAMENCHNLVVSPFYCSPPMGNVPQPDYINAVVSFHTSLAPIDLLDALQAIENNQGRVRIERWGPRTLDLDLLLYANQVIQLPRLTVPHYGMKQRSFVLIPLADIAPELVLPCNTPVIGLIDTNMRTELQQVSLDH